MGRVFPPIGVAVFGVSTPFACWGFNLVRLVVEAVVGATVGLQVYSLHQLREEFGSRNGGSVVMATDFPDADLAEFLSASGLPVIVFADAPEIMLNWTMRSRELQPDRAARLCSRICSAVAPSLTAKRRLSVIPEATSADIVARLVEFLWPGQGRRLRADKVDFSAVAGDAERQRIVSATPFAADLSCLTLARGLAAYADVTLGHAPEAIDWPLLLFTRPDGRRWGEPIELAGPARALMYGPYMHLPVGEWSARVEFELAGVLSGAEASADVRIDEVVAETAFALPQAGVYAYDLAFRVRDPHRPVEIRLFLRKSAIEGLLLPHSVTLMPARVRSLPLVSSASS